MKDTFDEHCESGLYSLKFHLFHHVGEDVEQFGSLEMLDYLLFDSFSVHIKRAY